MLINREAIKENLQQYLAGQMPKEKIYAWALSLVVDKEYDQAISKDKLLKDSIQALIEINHEEEKFVPTKEDLKYYLSCLKGEQTYVPIQKKKKSSERIGGIRVKDIFIICRIYIILFALSSIAIHVLDMTNPYLLMADGVAERVKTGMAFIPHLVYGLFLLFPIRITVQKPLFFITFFVFVAGFFYYCFIVASIIVKFSLHILVFLVLLPFSGLPAFLALMLLLRKRKEIFKQAPSIKD